MDIIISSIKPVLSKSLAWTSIDSSLCSSKVGKPSFTGQGPKLPLFDETKAAVLIPCFF